jgi:predicted unusual protein kinase regulating ubiquinone biosynthesis (AarF/ABC1/UbiB family)
MRVLSPAILNNTATTTPMLLLTAAHNHNRMFPEFEETVTLELDFVQEGTNCERVAR